MELQLKFLPITSSTRPTLSHIHPQKPDTFDLVTRCHDKHAQEQAIKLRLLNSILPHSIAVLAGCTPNELADARRHLAQIKSYRQEADGEQHMFSRRCPTIFHVKKSTRGQPHALNSIGQFHNWKKWQSGCQEGNAKKYYEDTHYCCPRTFMLLHEIPLPTHTLPYGK